MSTTTKNVGRVSIVPKGDWNINNTYIRLDLVTYNGNSYIAKKDVPKNIQLNNNGYWMLIASKGEQGAPFAIVKSYASIAAMNADFSNTNVQNGQFVIIDTGNVQDPDNAKLYYKGSNSYVFVTDLSGAAGIQGPRGASAYEQAVAGGYTGTEAQFNEELRSFKELSEQAANSAQQAASAAYTAERYMNSTSNYRDSASLAAQQALTRMNSADASAQDAEAYAVGKRKGIDVGSTDPAYHNNSKYYAEQAEDVLESIPDDYTELNNKINNLNNTFFAEYGVTTYNEIDTHVKDGNLVVLKQAGFGGGYYYTVLSGTSFGEVAGFPWNGYIFTKPAVAFGDSVNYTKIVCGSDDEWTTEYSEVRNINTDIVGTFYYANAYKIGDYVQQNGKIYRFIAPHTGGSYWNSSEVVEVVLGDEIGELKSALDAGLEILSYGSSTWADFLSAYAAKKIVYCRASSAADPSSGDQTRLAFMAFVNNTDNPTNVEFQYYRSIATHSDSQQGDQVFVYKLDKASGWSVTTRDTFTTIAVGDGLSKTYSNGTITLNADDSNLQKILQMDTPVLRNGSIGNAGNANAVSTTYALPTNGAKRVRVTMLHPKTAESDYYYWVVAFYNEAGGASSSTAQRIIDIDPYTYTHENTMVFDLNDTAAFAVTVFEYSESGSAVPLRVADVGNCLRIQYEYDVTDYPIIPGIGKGSMGNPSSTTAVRTSLATPLPEKFGYIKVDIKRTNIPDDVQFFYSVWAFNKTLIKTTDTNSRVAHLDNQSVDGTSFYIPSIFFPATSKSFGLTIYAKQDGQTFTLKGSNVGDFIRMHFINVPDVIIEDAYTRNKDKDSMLAAAVRYGKKSNNGKDFCILEITDSHSDPIAEQNSIQIANGFKYIDTLIHCGDFCADKAGNFNSEIYDRFIACEKSFYFVCGNHDVGNRKTVADCIDTATVYTRYIKPIVDAGLLASGEYQTGKSYYYHDFNDYNIRLICVYEYDDPNDLNPSNSAEYRINRGYSVISQAQAEWFCDTLISTPSGYSVVVAMHSSFSNLATADTSLKFTEDSKSGADNTQRLFSTDFWADAVNAFVTRSSYTCDMVCTGDAAYLNDSGTGKYYSFTKDFSPAVGSFLCFIGGHGHRDRIFVHPTYSYQKQVTAVCANTVNYRNSMYSDIRRTVEDSPSKDSLTAIGCDTGNKKIRLVKIGVNVTENMQYRDFEMIDVAPATP